MNEANNISVILSFVAIIISSFVTILCSILNPYLQNKRHQKEIKLNGLKETINKLLLFIKNTNSKNSENINNKLKLINEIQNNIFIYGSKKDNKIFILLKEYSIQNTHQENNYYSIVLIYILLSMLKYETSNIYLSADYLMRENLTDYQNIKKDVKIINNKIVKQEKLNRKYYIR